MTPLINTNWNDKNGNGEPSFSKDVRFILLIITNVKKEPQWEEKVAWSQRTNTSQSCMLKELFLDHWCWTSSRPSWTLKNPPQGEEALFLTWSETVFQLLGVDEAAYVKAGFLTAITKGSWIST